MTVSAAHEGEPASAGDLPDGGAKPSVGNGGRSRGPKTPRGKARVSVNAVRHGITATMPVVPGMEVREDWDAHRGGIVESLQPAGRLETVLAERVASMLWRLRRVEAFECVQLAHAPEGWVLPEGDLNAVIRYEAHLGRQLYRALHALQVLQARRRGDPVAFAHVEVHGLPEP